MNILQIGALIALIAFEFIRNALTALAVAVLLHALGCSDFFAFAGALVASAISWERQFKSLNNLLGE